MDVQQILAGAQDVLSARRVFGEPIQVNGTTIIPAATVRGGGGGGAKSEEGGAGFGVYARPAGAYIIKKDGQVTWRPAVDVNRIILGGQLVAITALLILGPVLRRWVGRKER